MKICHLIMAYKNPRQLERLINALKHPDCDIFIHVDKKVNFAQFINMNNSNEIIFIKNRVKVNWGGYSLIKAVCNSIDEIRSTGKHYNFINLLSAQDFPIKKVDDFIHFLDINQGKCFISYDEKSDSEWWNENIVRIVRYYFDDFSFKGKFTFQRIVNAFLPKRKFPNYLKLYGGNCSSWWVLNADAAYYFADTMRNDYKLRNFVQYTWAPDEYIYATVIMNSKYKDSVVNNNYRYIDWSEKKVNPKILKSADFSKIINTENFFARKFDIDIDSKIIDLFEGCL